MLSKKATKIDEIPSIYLTLFSNYLAVGEGEQSPVPISWHNLVAREFLVLLKAERNLSNMPLCGDRRSRWKSSSSAFTSRALTLYVDIEHSTE